MSMTSEDLKDALRSGAEVTYRDYFGIEYHGTIEAVVYRFRKGKITVSAEVRDLKANSVLEVKPERLSLTSESE